MTEKIDFIYSSGRGIRQKGEKCIRRYISLHTNTHVSISYRVSSPPLPLFPIQDTTRCYSKRMRGERGMGEKKKWTKTKKHHSVLSTRGQEYTYASMYIRWSSRPTKSSELQIGWRDGRLKAKEGENRRDFSHFLDFFPYLLSPSYPPPPLL